MKILGNIIWVVFGGWLVALEYLVAAVSLMVTIVGLLFGWQLLKIAWLSLLPFVTNSKEPRPISPVTRWFFNIIWLLFFGIVIVSWPPFAGASLLVDDCRASLWNPAF